MGTIDRRRSGAGPPSQIATAIYDKAMEMTVNEVVESEFSVIPTGTDFQIVMQSARRAYDDITERVATLLGDKTTARVWMITANPMMGGVTPVSMIAHGREHRLSKFITECENISNVG